MRIREDVSVRMITKIDFTDWDSQEEAFALIKAAPNVVALTLSLRSNGDVEVFLPALECERVIAALQIALAFARGSGDKGATPYRSDSPSRWCHDCAAL
jgi:hypothetical protein